MATPKWTLKKVAMLARSCSTRTEFKKKHGGAYRWAYNNGLLDDFCAHMSKPTRLSKWDFSKVQEIASQYSTRTEFQKQARGAYCWARENGSLELVCSHMKKVIVYDLEKVINIAQKYKNRGEFALKEASAYAWAKRNNKLSEVCSHMDILRNRWTFESAKEAALQFNSRSEFNKKCPGAYEWAVRNDFLEKICDHMKPIGHRYKRALYIYEFENGSAYIGLTYNYRARHLEHMRRGSVYEESRKAKFTYIELNVWMAPEIAQKEEERLIEKYISDGWNVLNVAKAGSLGGSTVTWDLDAVKKEGLKYKTKKEFREKSGSAYVAACKIGMDKACPHLKNLRKSWDLESIKKEGRKYKTKREFSQNSTVAYGLAVEIGIEKVCPHLSNLREAWSLEKVQKEALCYDTRGAFQNGSKSAYVWAQRNGKLDLVCGHMKSGKKRDKKWCYESAKKVASEFETISELKKKWPGAYGWLLRNDKLAQIKEEVFL